MWLLSLTQRAKHFIPIAILSFCFYGKNALAVINEPVKFYNFPITQKVAEQVWFWEFIFQKYPSTSTVLHDVYHPQVIIDIVDFELFSKRFNQGKMYTPSQKKQVLKKYIDRYKLAIKRVRKERHKALRHGSMEKRIYEVYSRNKSTLKALYSGHALIRTQDGLADEFKRAVVRAKKYLPHMEKIFSEANLPIDLTRLAFVESMFNVHATSKVGASGIWQFMPTTGKDFLTINHFIDERNSPLKATKAAASLLKRNHSLLDSWPLAITAYNHGAAGMRRAVRKVRTKDLSKIIVRYKSRTFGFASRNFYSEFIAARNTYNRFYARSTEYNSDPLAIRPLRLNKPLSVYQILRYTPLDKMTLKKFNLCLKPKAFNRYQYRRLPADFEIIVPNNLAPEVRYALKRISPSKKR